MMDPNIETVRSHMNHYEAEHREVEEELAKVEHGKAMLRAFRKTSKAIDKLNSKIANKERAIIRLQKEIRNVINQGVDRLRKTAHERVGVGS